MPEVKRSVRVAERLREALAELLTREVRDPRVASVALTEVTMTSDLQQAKVLVRSPAGETPEGRKALLAGLASASGLLRREIGHRLGLRYAPRLVFFYDEAPEKRDRIDMLLDEIARAPRGRESE
jgi:ribosome-binding factor A